MEPIAETDLIINADGSIYHLNLLPGDVADTVITVGDPDRVGGVSKYFDEIELKKVKREFITHTGRIGSKRLTVISTGIGTDNIDIVLNELDALVNINFKTRLVNKELKKLNIIRIGTSGAIQPDVTLNSLLVSSAAFGLDALMGFYKHQYTAAEQMLLEAFRLSFPANLMLNPYLAAADHELLNILAADTPQGITLTAPGFYGPQGRQVRASVALPALMDIVAGFNYQSHYITNLEMETAGIYGLSRVLGHRAISFNVILANRANKMFSKQPDAVVDRYIQTLLKKISKNL